MILKCGISLNPLGNYSVQLAGVVEYTNCISVEG